MSNYSIKDLKNHNEVSVFTKNKDLIVKAKIASSYFARLKGLLGKSELKSDEGLLIIPCTSIHMFFMAFAIDAVFIDIHGQIVAIYHNLKPWRISKIHPEAYAVLELPSGKLKQYKIQKGDKLEFE